MLPHNVNVYSDDETVKLLEQHRVRGRNLGSLLYARAAESDGATIEWHSSSACVATRNGVRVLINGYIANQSQVGAKMVEDKFLTKALLERAGVSVPAGWIVESAEAAVAALSQTKKSLVIKPRAAFGGKGVAVGIGTPDAAAAAYSSAAEQGTGVLAEELIEGSVEYRCIATPDKCLSVVRRILPYVTGNGLSTIRDLIVEKNTQRELNPSTYNRYTPIDEQTQTCLEAQGLHLDSVLETGRTVTVRNVGGLSSGGEPEECSDRTPATVKQVAIAAVRAIPGLTWGGCDVLVEESTGRPYVIEINSSADITGSMFPYFGRPKNVALTAWKLRRDERDPGSTFRAPLIHKRADELSTIGSEHPNIWRSATTLRLATVLKRAAKLLGYSIEASSTEVVQIFDDDGSPSWFTHEMSGVRDLAVVRRTLRRHGTVRSLLRSGGIARVSGRRVRTASDIHLFLDERQVARAILIPPRQEWASRPPLLIGNTEDLASEYGEPRGWVVQSYPLGKRVRVFATPTRCMWILGDDPDAAQLTAETVSRCGALAIEAVSSVPGLRWAAVDIVVSERRRPNGTRTHRLLVEGIAVNPLLTPRSIEVAGSLGNLINKVVRG